MFTGNFINGRHLYAAQNQVYGIWFDGEYGDAADWVAGYMTSIIEGKLRIGWAMSNEDTSCPSLSKVWIEWWNSQWQYSRKASIECLSGYHLLLFN